MSSVPVEVRGLVKRYGQSRVVDGVLAGAAMEMLGAQPGGTVLVLAVAAAALVAAYLAGTGTTGRLRLRGRSGTLRMGPDGRLIGGRT